MIRHAAKLVRLAVFGISTSFVGVFTAVFSGVITTGYASVEVLSDMDCVVEPSRTIELGAAVPGLLAESFFDRSDSVAAGEVMARLESNVERVSLAIAKESANSSTAIELRLVNANFGNRTQDRNAELLKESNVSEQVMDQVRTEARIADLRLVQEEEVTRLALLEVERARATLDRREIRSPINGSITERYKNTGEYVDREPVYQVVQLDPLHVEVIVPVQYRGNLKKGMRASVSLRAPGFEDKTIEALVSRIDAVADAASATYGVRLVIDNPDLKIPGGVRCQVDFLAS